MRPIQIKVSSEFKAQTTKAIAFIGLFILTYILMLALAVGLTVLCVYAGIFLILLKPMFITIVLGVGLASLGILVLFFLLKFIFKSHKVDRSHLTEITNANEPELFKLIDEIVQKVGTSFPKKVYLSADVNAAVFYDSSFWSMFFPIRKNLQIGMGLVNTISKSELTAILSHEFGHFSQKSMKVGTYVYNVNQVIFNLLYDNEGYDKLIQKWASVSSYFSIFVVASVRIIEGIQWVLKEMYAVVNKSYMGLSREMEFHADEIAANVTGYEPLKSSLLRMSIADHAYKSVLSFYDNRISENKKSENIFKEQFFVMSFLSQENNVEIRNNLPQVSGQELNKFNKSKLTIKDQWASHPSEEDRINMLEKTGLSSTNIDHESANLLFSDAEKTQENLSNTLFESVTYSGECSTISFEIFQAEFKKEFLENTFPKLFKGYYDNKNPVPFGTQQVGTDLDNVKLDDLFSDTKIDMVYTAIALENDIETLKQIAYKSLKVKTFDYAGVRYGQKESNKLIQQLKKELELLNEKIAENDFKIYHYFKKCQNANNSVSNMESLYEQFLKQEKELEAKYEIYTTLSNELQFINFTTPFEQIRANFFKIEPLEKKLKKEIQGLMDDGNYRSQFTDEIKSNFNLYLSKDWKYFGTEVYFDKNLEMLFAAMNNYAFMVSKGHFLLKRDLLNHQADLVLKTQDVALK